MASASEKKIGICNLSRKRLENFVQILVSTRQTPKIIIDGIENSTKEYKNNKCTPSLDTLIQTESEQYQNNVKMCFDLPYPRTILQCIEDTENGFPMHNLDKIEKGIEQGKLMEEAQRKMTGESSQPSFYG